MTQESSVTNNSASLISLLDQAQLGRSSLIRITGPNGLSTLLWLCRHGYEKVGYLRSGHDCPHEQPDGILVAHTCDQAWLDGLLASGPHVREGGALIFQTTDAAPSKGAQTDPIHDLLERRGYAVERCVHGAHREVHVARRLAHDWRKAA